MTMRLVLLSLIVRCLILSQLKAVNAASESLAVKDDEDEDEADSSLSSWQRQLLGIQQGWQWAMTMGNTATAESIRPAPVTLQIARVGMAQTGTASLDAALTELGYSPLQQSHMAEISDLLHAFFSNHISTNSFVRGLEDKGFDTIYAYHDRYIEWVADRAHEALEGKTEEDRDFRVILSVHDDAKAWAKSWVAMADLFRILITHQPFQFRARAQLFVPVLQGIEEFHRGPTSTPEQYKDLPTIEAAYLRHVERVKRLVPAEKLLIYNVQQGWEPLCAFLNKPVPQGVPFPYVEEDDVLRVSVATLWTIVYLWRLMIVVVVIMIAIPVLKWVSGGKGKKA